MGEASIIGPDYSEQLNKISNNLEKTYLTDKTLYFRECLMRLFVNIEFDHNDKNTRIIIKDCIYRAKMLTDEVFND